MKFSNYKNNGFTLIELLVVVAIISLLSSIVLATLKDARNKAMWSKFDTEFLQIKTAIELYRADNNGNYPSSVTGEAAIQTVINELNSYGLYPKNSIDLPTGYVFGSANPATPGPALRDTYTCGSANESGNSYSLFFSISGSDFSKIPLMYINGVLQNKQHCFEI